MDVSSYRELQGIFICNKCGEGNTFDTKRKVVNHLKKCAEDGEVYDLLCPNCHKYISETMRKRNHAARFFTEVSRAHAAAAAPPPAPPPAPACAYDEPEDGAPPASTPAPAICTCACACACIYSRSCCSCACPSGGSAREAAALWEAIQTLREDFQRSLQREMETVRLHFEQQVLHLQAALQRQLKADSAGRKRSRSPDRQPTDAQEPANKRSHTESHAETPEVIEIESDEDELEEEEEEEEKKKESGMDVLLDYLDLYLEGDSAEAQWEQRHLNELQSALSEVFGQEITLYSKSAIFRKMSLQLHPDKQRHPNPTLQVKLKPFLDALFDALFPPRRIRLTPHETHILRTCKEIANVERSPLPLTLIRHFCDILGLNIAKPTRSSLANAYEEFRQRTDSSRLHASVIDSLQHAFGLVVSQLKK